MIEVQIRRPCTEARALERRPGPGIEGAECPECGAYTYKRDRRIDHELVIEFVDLAEFKRLLAEEKE